MKRLMMMAGAAALFAAGPALAKPGNGHGNGNGHGDKKEKGNIRRAKHVEFLEHFGHRHFQWPQKIYYGSCFRRKWDASGVRIAGHRPHPLGYRWRSRLVSVRNESCLRGLLSDSLTVCEGTVTKSLPFNSFQSHKTNHPPQLLLLLVSYSPLQKTLF